MCENHDGLPGVESGGGFAATRAAPPKGMTRRDWLRLASLGASAMTVSGLMPGRARALGSTAAGVPGFDGRAAFRTAQHIHARGSEGPGSMTAQATEAAKWVDAMWFTDHDYREAGIGAPTVVHFNSLTAEALTPNPPWKWVRRDAGRPATGSGGGIDTTLVSPADPDPSGALWARAVGEDDRPASVVWYADDGALRGSMRTPAHGQVWTVEVLVSQSGRQGYGLLRVALSYHPASGGRPPSYYFLEYRFGPFAARGYRVEELDVTATDDGGAGGDGGTVVLHPGEKALAGVVEVPQPLGAWTTQTLRFTDDVEVLFPDLIARDNSIRGLWLGATSVGGRPARASFDYLRMTRVTGQPQFEDRRTITAELSERFPGLALYDGSEVSYAGAHRHWLGGDIELSTYNGTLRARNAPAPDAFVQVQRIRAGGGLAMANHPFGTNGRQMSDTEAAAAAGKFLDEVVATGTGGGLQAVEIFYRQRGGASFDQHWQLFRAAVRRGIVLTATGVSDNHWGAADTWKQESNRFTTALYADGVEETALLAAQVRGRAFSVEIGSSLSQLDLSLDGDVMGQIGVRPRPVSRDLTVLAAGLPRKAVVEVWKIPVDGGRSSVVDDQPGGVVATIPASGLRAGTATVRVDTDTDCAFALTVTAGSRRIAGSNPVWHLRSEPSWSIPAERRATPA